MLLSITTTHTPATDLGYLLSKNPAHLHTREFGFGQAHVFYPEASESRCTAILLLDLDPLKLRTWQRRSGVTGDSLFDYVNDRPYVASSFLSVALAKAFGSALAGTSRERPQLAGLPLPLTATLVAVRCRGGEEIARRIFEPLGYSLSVEALPLDPEIGLNGGNLFTLTLAGQKTIRDLLTHLYVLMPVLDDQKHYAFGEDEVDKLLGRGKEWLATHPDRDLIVTRYLRYRRRLTSEALARLLEAEGPQSSEDQGDSEPREELLEKPLTLGEQRTSAVRAALRGTGARRIIDLGCGEGRLISELLADNSIEQITGVDVSTQILERAGRRLRLDRLPERQAKRVELLLGSLTLKDRRLVGFDAAAVIEVIEHLEPDAVQRFTQSLFGYARPKSIVLTTPNRDYNVRFENLPNNELRHPDHRFEWTREEFTSWANQTSDQFGYAVRFETIGDVDPELGAPTQMAVFST